MANVCIADTFLHPDPYTNYNQITFWNLINHTLLNIFRRFCIFFSGKNKNWQRSSFQKFVLIFMYRARSGILNYHKQPLITKKLSGLVIRLHWQSNWICSSEVSPNEYASAWLIDKYILKYTHLENNILNSISQIFYRAD